MQLRLKAQLYHGDEIAFGPGKADLLEAIDRTGSIAAAARELEMSYRRAWLLVDTMNRCFRSPLVESGRGGSERGGARLTAAGNKTLKHYRAMMKALDRTAAPHLRKFDADLR